MRRPLMGEEGHCRPEQRMGGARWGVTPSQF